MNKKNYFEPEMEIVEIELSQMLCGSVEDNGETEKEEGEGGEGDF